MVQTHLDLACILSSNIGSDSFRPFISGSRRKSSSCLSGSSCSDLEVTHRGMHQFIPRHSDEMAIEIGDPLHVVRTGDDLWCEGRHKDIVYNHIETSA